jgi:hypothetical protein
MWCVVAFALVCGSHCCLLATARRAHGCLVTVRRGFCTCRRKACSWYQMCSCLRLYVLFWPLMTTSSVSPSVLCGGLLPLMWTAALAACCVPARLNLILSRRERSSAAAQCPRDAPSPRLCTFAKDGGRLLLRLSSVALCYCSVLLYTMASLTAPMVTPPLRMFKFCS